MDRRQRKTRAAIYSAFTQLLSKKDFSQVTVQEIIDAADVGRATFYAHFETKDYLLKEMCEELFGHILGRADTHYKCDINCSFYLHLLRHIKNNDDNILRLFSGKNNELFLWYFKRSLSGMLLDIIDPEVVDELKIPQDFLVNYISSVFTQTVLWWADRGFFESPEQISGYLESVIGKNLTNCCKI